MIKGYKRFDGKMLYDTRLSNTTFIENTKNFYIEDNVYIGHYNYLDASNNLTIEEGCQLTNFINIVSHSSHISIRLYGKEYLKHKNLKGYIKGEVIIGKYSFIGPYTLIMPGTKIGKGSLVKAYSYVKGVFPEFSIISGNPAVRIGDTRNIDKKYIDDDQELRMYYNEWALKND